MNFAINIENWRLISGYDNYEISSHGRVRNNKTNRIMKTPTTINGYKNIGLSKDAELKTYNVHRLVAFAFLEKTDEDTDVDHINHDKSNNMVTNIRWVTTSQNCRNASRRTDNQSGTSGVHFDKSKNSWVASWYNDEKQKSKSFSINKYGNEESKRLAMNYRRDKARENGYLNI